jgi:tRNA U34 2-thiouridine synthase MnmA/TrmU
VLNEESHPIGIHSGAAQFTLGQRHGFRLTDSSSVPKYVSHISVRKNTITVSETYPLGSSTVIARSIIRYADIFEKKQYDVQVRYHGIRTACTVEIKDAESCVLHLSNPQLVASGQLCAVYDGPVLVMSCIADTSVDE